MEEKGGEKMESAFAYMLDKACCFTGHRPMKLKRTEEEIKADLETEIRKAHAEGYRVFINGAQQGVDIYAAEVVMKLMDEGLSMKLPLRLRNV